MIYKPPNCGQPFLSPVYGTSLTNFSLIIAQCWVVYMSSTWRYNPSEGRDPQKHQYNTRMIIETIQQNNRLQTQSLQ